MCILIIIFFLSPLIIITPLQMDRQSDGELMMDNDHLESKNKACLTDAVGCLQIYCLVGCSLLRECIKLLVNHRRFQQCILLAILINTLSMGIEYHNQVTQNETIYLYIIIYLFLLYFCPHHYMSLHHTYIGIRNSYASQ